MIIFGFKCNLPWFGFSIRTRDFLNRNETWWKLVTLQNPSCPGGCRAGPSGRALYRSKSGKDTQVETPAKPYIGSKSWRRLVTLPGHPRSRGTNALTRAIKLLVSARSAKTQKTRPKSGHPAQMCLKNAKITQIIRSKSYLFFQFFCSKRQLPFPIGSVAIVYVVQVAMWLTWLILTKKMGPHFVISAVCRRKKAPFVLCVKAATTITTTRPVWWSAILVGKAFWIIIRLSVFKVLVHVGYYIPNFCSNWNLIVPMY